MGCPSATCLLVRLAGRGGCDARLPGLPQSIPLYAAVTPSGAAKGVSWTMAA